MNILFDLDGTLTDPFLGISSCIVHACRGLAIECPPPPALRAWIGPPLRASFANLLGPSRRHEVERAMTLYRQRFSTIGLFENDPYDGIASVLESARSASATLFVATSKPQVYAQQILEHFELAEFFKAIHGAELDGARSEKAEVIEHVLQTHGLNAGSCLMVGDREHDVHGAAQHGIPTVGVCWGYGGVDELRAAGAFALCVTPAELATELNVRIHERR